MFDSHIHTTFSTDSKMNIEEAIEKGKNLGIGLIITEHMDFKFPVEGEFLFDPKEYFNAYNKFRNDEVLLGIEIGLRTDCIEESLEVLKEGFDFILGSVHAVDGIDLYGEEFYIGKSKKEAMDRYLDYSYETIEKCDYFHSLGHIDYISRYCKYEDKEIYYKDFKDRIHRNLNLLSEKEKAMEINTRRLNNKIAYDNLNDIYNAFKEEGGKYVTIGSDSHNKEAIGLNFKEAINIAENNNLKPVYFKNGKMEYMKY